MLPAERARPRVLASQLWHPAPLRQNAESGVRALVHVSVFHLVGAALSFGILDYITFHYIYIYIQTHIHLHLHLYMDMDMDMDIGIDIDMDARRRE